MKLKIGPWNVEITATHEFFPRESDTIDFLNQLIPMYLHNADRYAEEGSPDIAREDMRCGMDIYDALKAAGAYDFAK